MVTLQITLICVTFKKSIWEKYWNCQTFPLVLMFFFRKSQRQNNLQAWYLSSVPQHIKNGMDLFIASYKVHLFGKEIPGTVLLKQRLFQKNYLVFTPWIQRHVSTVAKNGPTAVERMHLNKKKFSFSYLRCF